MACPLELFVQSSMDLCTSKSFQKKRPEVSVLVILIMGNRSNLANKSTCRLSNLAIGR